MAKLEYYAKEDTNLGIRSFYAVPVTNDTLTFNEVCKDTCHDMSIEPSIIKAIVTECTKVMQANVLKGFSISIGEQFIMLYPNLNALTKNTENKTAEMLSTKKGKIRLDSSVSVRSCQNFADNVLHLKMDKFTGISCLNRTSLTESRTTPSSLLHRQPTVILKGNL